MVYSRIHVDLRKHLEGALDPVDDFAAVDDAWQIRPRNSVVSDAVHDALRECIVRGQLSPGIRLSEEVLARRLAVSRTPVREALLRLESERLVERHGRGGLVVGEVSPSEILEVYAVRQALNALTARLAAESATAAQLATARWLNEQLRQAGAEGNYPKMAEINLRFHEVLCDATRNGLLRQLIEEVHDRVRRFPGTTFSYPGRAVTASAEHNELLDAIEAHDGDLAASLAQGQMTTSMGLRIEMLRMAQETATSARFGQAAPADRPSVCSARKRHRAHRPDAEDSRAVSPADPALSRGRTA